MQERIKQIRLFLKLTQEEFGARIGLTNASISRIESGSTVTTEQTIRSICREYNVNEAWLRTGEGEMFKPYDRARELEAVINDRFSTSSPEFRRDLLQVLLRFDPEKPEWNILEAILHHLVSTLPKDPDPPTTEP
jgi:transcriptional regulator with XRE-family HTH domain